MSRTIADASRDYRNRRKERMARMEALEGHFEAMQEMMVRYVAPGVYTDLQGNRSDNGDGLERCDLRSALFARDMIYMMDGPEQRAIQN